MKSFLFELAEDIHRSHRQLENLTIVFPNRRAVIYFRKHLGDLLDKPAFSPRMITIEDFITDFSDFKVPDKLELIHRLYTSYQNIIQRSESAEPFDKFFFWGDMLLRDFDELDKYLIPAEQIFRDLSVQKEMDSLFEFLTEEQREFLQSFWKSFEDNLSVNKEKFLSVWKRLYQLYSDFTRQLSEAGLAYEGMMHREVATQLEKKVNTRLKERKIIFAGFNALTKAEEKIITFFVEKHNGKVYWDLDAYYLNNSTQEAGRFFREYQRNDILGKTFDRVPANFLGSQTSTDVSSPEHTPKVIRLFGAAEPLSQTKLMAQVLQEEFGKGLDPENTVIVLPDEKLLLPVLHGLSGSIEKLNVTMGFPLASTPVFSLTELLVDLQITRKNDHFNHRQVLAILGHPYVVAADPIAANAKRKEILRHNWVHIPKSYLATTVDVHRQLFQEATAGSILPYLHASLNTIGEVGQIGDLDKEYIFNFLKLLNRMEEVIGTSVDDTTGNKKGHQVALKSFLRLIRQLIQSHKIPFSGEPLRGLQVMGVLETRNLDYKNVFILSLNEGAFPAYASKGSYIPFNIRKAYGLPTVEHQDAMYAYLFYRVLQRAENICLFYNSETDVLGQGEMSRYLQQLIYETGLPVEKKVLHNTLLPKPVTPIVIPKNLEAVIKLNEGNSMFKGISPSALNTYIECRLRFYLQYIARIREADEVEEDLDARILGTFLHRVMELLYTGIRDRKSSKLIEVSDLADAEQAIDRLVDQVFIEQYRLDPSKTVEYEGQRLIVREVVRRFAHRIVEIDRSYAPFTMEATEQGGMLYVIPLKDQNQSVILNGKIDRVDLKGNILRVIDYKTGKDQLDFESVPSLFARDVKRNKAAFQTLLYALLYKANAGTAKHKIVPGLINRMNLFDKDFQFGLKVGKTYIDDIEPLLKEFEDHLTSVLEELFSPDVPFDQTTNTDACKFCAYQEICYR